MKTLNISFTDLEFARMKKAKNIHGKYLPWREFILIKCCKGLSVRK